MAEEQRSFLDEFPTSARGRVAGHFAGARKVGGTPEEIVQHVVDVVNFCLRSWAGGGPHYETDCQLVRLCHEKRDLALAYAAREPLTAEARARLWDAWGACFRKAVALGLDPVPLNQDVPDEDLRRAGSALWKAVAVREAQKEAQGG